jgi:outer membrane protein assembly factor BamB
MPPVRLAVLFAALSLFASPAHAQLPPLPPIGGDEEQEEQPPPAERPPAEAPAAPAGPISPAPGSVAEGVDVGHSGSFDDPDLVPPLVVRWKVPSQARQILAAGGRVFTVELGGVVSRDASTGKELWRAVGLNAESAAYGDGAVYLPTGGEVVALAEDSGAVRWRRPLGGTHRTQSVVAAGGAVYVVGFDGSPALFALRASDGAVAWQTDTMDRGTPALDDERVYLLTGCGGGQAFSRATGQPAWAHKTRCGGSADATLTKLWGGALYASRSVHATDTGAGTGQLPQSASEAVFADDRVVGHAGVPDGIVATALSTGARVWKAGDTASGPLVAANHNVFHFASGTGSDRFLVGRSLATGAPVWSMKIDAFQESDRAFGVAPGLLLVRSMETLYALQSALRPAPGGVALASSARAVPAGGRLRLIAVTGRDLRTGRRVALEGSQTGRRLRRFARVAPAADGGLAYPVRVFHNSTFRARVGNARSGVVRAYAYPRARLGHPRSLGGRRVSIAVRVSAPRTRLAGRRFVLYLAPRRGSLRRLGTARLRAVGQERTAATLRFNVPSGTSERDGIAWCVRGQLRLRLGAPSPLLRRCGASRIRS